MSNNYVRQPYDYRNKYVSPIKQRNQQVVQPPSSTTQKKQHPRDTSPSKNSYQQRIDVSKITDRSASPLVSQQPSRRESYLGKMNDLISMNEKLREEADYWHRKMQESHTSQPQLSESDQRRLISLCEKQSSEIQQLKSRLLESEEKVNQLEQELQQNSVYTQHFQTMGNELTEQIRSLEQLNNQINERDQSILKLQRNEDNLKTLNAKQGEEINQLRRVITQIQKEKQQQSHAKEQITSQQMDALQNSHMNQLSVLNEQILQLQQELVRKSEQYEQLSVEYENQVQESNYLREQEDTLSQTVNDMDQRFQLFQEEKQQEIKSLQQSKDSQLQHLSKMNNDLRLQSQSKIQQLEQQIRDLQIENQRQRNEVTTLQVQLQDSNTQIKIYSENIEQMQIQHEDENKNQDDIFNQQMDCVKSTYQRQLDELVSSVDKLRNVLNEKQDECEQHKQSIEQMTNYLQNAEVNENDLIRELEHWKTKYEEFQVHCENEIHRLDESNQQYLDSISKVHNAQLDQMDEQIHAFKQLLDSKIQETEDLRMQKTDISIKLNDSNVAIKHIQSELEQLKVKFIESQRQYDVEEQVKEEIKRSQTDQLRRQYEAQLDQYANENRNIKFLLEGKIKECEEWKNSYLRNSSRNVSQQG